MTLIFVGFFLWIPSLATPAHATAPIAYLIPLYSYPTSSNWAQLITDAAANPTVQIYAIANVASGPGGSSNPDYVTGISNLQAAGIKVLGYVDSNYGSIAISTVETNMDHWRTWYSVNGIFVDEMNNIAGGESYYSALLSYGHAHSQNPMIGNPGTSIGASYIGTMDVIISYEYYGYPSPATVESRTTSVGGTRTNWGIIAFSQATVPSITQFSNVEPYIAYVFVTDQAGPPGNPYLNIPTYENQELINLAGTSPPPSGNPTIQNECKTNLDSQLSNSCTINSAAGDALIITGQAFVNTVCGTFTPSLSFSNPTVTMKIDAQSETSDNGVSCLFTVVGHGIMPSIANPGTATFTTGVSPAGNNLEVSMEAFDVSGLSIGQINTGVDSVTNNHCTSCTSLADSTVSTNQLDASFGSFIAATFIASTPTFSSISQFTTYGPPSGTPCSAVDTDWLLCGAFNLSPSGSTTMGSTITATGSSNIYATRAVASYGIAVPTYVVVACNFFQIQCWWYPFLMYLVVLVPFAMIGVVGKVPSKNMGLLFLGSITYCSLIQVIMDMGTPLFPILLTLAAIAYALRT